MSHVSGHQLRACKMWGFKTFSLFLSFFLSFFLSLFLPFLSRSLSLSLSVSGGSSVEFRQCRRSWARKAPCAVAT